MRPLVRAVLAVALGLTLASCRAGTAPTEPLDVRVTVQVGETVAVAGGSFNLRFNAVPQDSRCPGDAMCIAPGYAVVDLTLGIGRREIAVQLTTEPSRARAVVDGMAVELVQLDPYPFLGSPHQPGDYRLTIRLLR